MPAMLDAESTLTDRFFRYHAPSRMIVYVWVNDEDSKRAYERDDDAYRVFRRMLDSGHPPGDWDQLLVEARACTTRMPAIATAYTGPSSS